VLFQSIEDSEVVSSYQDYNIDLRIRVVFIIIGVFIHLHF
jgi:hypothetical protein